jgi:hypothetical protein
MSELNPNNTDAILGGQNLPLINAAVLGGEIARKQQLQQEKAIARENKFWRNFEYLDGLPDRHAKIFADRQVIDFEPGMDLFNPQETAYALRKERSTHKNNKYIQDLWHSLLQCHNVNEVEALVFGDNDEYNNDYIKSLVKYSRWLTNLKAIFLGDVNGYEMMISKLSFAKNISPVLSAYPELEILQVRGGGRYDRLEFSKGRHKKLKALRIESGGLRRSVVTGLNQLELPALEYLELWLGSEKYGGNSSIIDLMPIISGDRFPKLEYLGLRNCEYTDDIAFQLAQSPMIEQLFELDLSMGTLTDQGLLALLKCSNFHKLARVNISMNYISDKFISEILPEFKLDLDLDISNQRYLERRGYNHRYCVVGE